ncbi:hypothetical protein HWV62_18364 [Athelia sp. TMB]|nr:hypothetical protein HWV62_18364 [Athelia sp. TMB]
MAVDNAPEPVEDYALPVSELIEDYAQEHVSTVYVFDLAEQVGFGQRTLASAKENGPAVVSLQTRAGAGLSIVGRLSEGTSAQTAGGAVLAAYTTPTGLARMAPALAHLPPASPASRLVVHAAAATPAADTLALSPSLAPLALAWPLLPQALVVLLSATPQEALEFSRIAHALPQHVVHVFDHYAGAREQLPAADTRAPQSDGSTLPAPFAYTGPAAPGAVLVLLNGPLALAAAALAPPGVGVLAVRVLRPWDAAALRAALPPSAATVHVFDDVPAPGTHGALFADALGALAGTGPRVVAHRITPAQTQAFFAAPSALRDALQALAPATPNEQVTPTEQTPTPLDAPHLKKLLFFSTPSAPLASLPAYIAQRFRAKNVLAARLLRAHDALSRAGGLTADRLLLAPPGDAAAAALPLPLVLPLGGEGEGKGEGASDFLCVLEPALLKTHALLAHAKRGSSVLVFAPWTPAETLAHLPAPTKALIVARALHLYVFHPDPADSRFARGALPQVLGYLAFLQLYLGAAATPALVASTAAALLGDTIEGVGMKELGAHAWARLEAVEVVEEEAAEAPKAAPPALKGFEFNAVVPAAYAKEDAGAGARLGTWHDAAKHLLWADAFAPPPLPAADEAEEEYPQDPALRPELPERTYLVTTAVNRRLTPAEYDRNVFHLEFATAGTGLRYAVGEALGVHGWNDADEVLGFCKWYGADPERVITAPLGAGAGGRMHARTVFQVLQQQADLFGRPPRTFYAELAAHATSSYERHALLFIGSAEGASTFKKLAEVDTVNYVDVLRAHPSARPSVEVLAALVGDIKPRHYSIASAQSVVGDRVDLLVVTVDWVTPSGKPPLSPSPPSLSFARADLIVSPGSPRYGQCTRYLAGLKPGQQVTVSLKPSVMKLPPSAAQPLIMAGLGTGAAPFRAFLQHRAHTHTRAHGQGLVHYYFGSRHQASEYLYGEEIEAYVADGTIAKAGLAFSRDGREKVYIQHRMREDAEALVRMLHDEQGVFYLCGPTWPVPDIYKALVEALVKYKGFTPEGAGEYLEGLKEEERYVLEVY